MDDYDLGFMLISSQTFLWLILFILLGSLLGMGSISNTYSDTQKIPITQTNRSSLSILLFQDTSAY